MVPTIALLWLLALPIAVGSMLRSWVPDWLGELGLQDGSQLASGWFASALDIDEPVDLELTARHFPPLGLSWVEFDGQLRTELSPRPYDINGELSLSGASRIELIGRTIRLDGAVQLTGAATTLRLDQDLDRPSRLDFTLDALSLEDGRGNRLNADRARLGLSWSDLDEAHLALSLSIALDAADPLSLVLHAEPVQREALADLIEGLQQLARTEPRSRARQFALLTVAGAWQQMSQAGLTLRLESLQLGEGNRFEGDWKTDAGQPLVDGQGRVEPLIRALAPIVGLSAQLPPDQVEPTIRAWLEALQTRGWLRVDGGEFEFRYAGPEAASSAPASS
ncbi:hypothetical protein AY599_06190 [Leptolyngbya valderiana BDU 20041]|nr:hypothetical protein AY599_06190 [Leptolyngbya valderiana BDU 20041]